MQIHSVLKHRRVLLTMKVCTSRFVRFCKVSDILDNVCLHRVQGVVHFKKKKTTFADNLLTPMSSKMSMSFFLQWKRNEGF